MKGLFEQGRNQAVLISGESGAGKTESAKCVLSYIAEVSGSQSAGIDGRILNTNPVLEAFGNAKTSRNNNSSRFGKWIEIIFDLNTNIRGGEIIDYLLESTRILSQTASDRNFHIFYYVCAGEGNQEKFDLKPVSEIKSYQCCEAGILRQKILARIR
jgi:myosin I